MNVYKNTPVMTLYNGGVINHRHGPKASMKEQHAKSID